MAKQTKALAVRQNKEIQIKNTAWQSLSAATQRSYTADYKLFFKIIKKNPTQVVASDVLDFIKYLEKNGYKNSSINRKIASLSKMFRVMALAGEIKNNPVEILKQFQNVSFKTSKGVQIALTMQDIKTVTKITKATSAHDQKTIIFIRVLASTGMRVSECINIKHEDIRAFNDKIYIVRIVGKGKKERKIYIGADLLRDVKKVFPDENQYLFYTRSGARYDRKNVWADVHEIFQRKIGKDVHPHTLRHWYATHMISIEKKDIKAVSLALGHSDIGITLSTYVDTELKADEASIKI